jgi:hypothetical protein
MVTDTVNRQATDEYFSVYSLAPVRDGGEEDTPPAKIVFTPEQQEKVNELIKDAQGRAAKELKAQYAQSEAKVAELEAKLNEALEASKKAKTSAERKDASEDIEALRLQMEEMKSASLHKQTEVEQWKQRFSQKEQEVKQAKEETLAVRKQNAMHNAASSVGFVNPEIPVRLLEHNIQWDEDRQRFVVKGEGGTLRMNAALEPMSLKEFYEEFATNNSYLVRSESRGGTGASESQRGVSMRDAEYPVEKIFGKNSSAKLANDLKRSNPKEYARLKAKAKEQGLIG